jgi:hypothetical protein
MKNIKQYLKNYRHKIRLEVLAFYSDNTMKCRNCGYSDVRALCLDHINNDGAKYRKEKYNDSRQGGGTIDLFNYLRKNNYPSGYQVLCWNCNHIKHLDFIEYKNVRKKIDR